MVPRLKARLQALDRLLKKKLGELTKQYLRGDN